MSNRYRVLALVSLAFNLGFVAMYGVSRMRQPGPPGPPPHDFPPREMRQSLGLTAEQTARMQELEQSFHTDTDRLRREGDEAWKVLDQVLDSNAGDAAVAKQVDAIAAVQRRMILRMVEQERRLRSILSPEQMQQFRSAVRPRGRGGPGGGGPGGGPDGPPGFGHGEDRGGRGDRGDRGDHREPAGRQGGPDGPR